MDRVRAWMDHCRLERTFRFVKGDWGGAEGLAMRLNMRPKPVTREFTNFAFVTPIRVFHYECYDEWNASLCAKILGIRNGSIGERRSNIGGWHSNSKFLSELGEPDAGILVRMFLENVHATIGAVAELTEAPGQAAVEAWALVNERGDSHAPHIHPGCPWSGVYYVATERNADGFLTLTDPRPSALMVAHPLNPFHATNNFTIEPWPGMFVVFPSFVYHAVTPYQGSSPRVSIAFNLR